MPQMATYKAKIHALHTVLTNMAEKSELQATVGQDVQYRKPKASS